MTPGAPNVMLNARARLRKILRGFRAVPPVLAVVLVGCAPEGRPDPDNPASIGLGIVAFLLLLLLYFMPAAVAHSRKHNNYVSIFLVNLMLGWTVVGWAIALIWAHSDNTKDRRHKVVVKPDHPLDSLVACRMCGRQISPQATACPGCGHPQARADDKIQDGTDN